MGNNIPVKLVIIFVLMITSLVYGYFLIKSEQSHNCWDQYTTEVEAIQHCEVHP